MKISKEIRWIQPYLDSVKHILDMSNITHISTRKTSIKRRESYVALCTKYTDDTYRLMLLTHFQSWHYKKDGKKCLSKIKKHSKIDFLSSLAHELAHVIAGFSHTPQHKLYECKMMEIFMKKLLEENYVSEEEEVKVNKKTGVIWVS